MLLVRALQNVVRVLRHVRGQLSTSETAAVRHEIQQIRRSGRAIDDMRESGGFVSEDQETALEVAIGVVQLVEDVPPLHPVQEDALEDPVPERFAIHDWMEDLRLALAAETTGRTCLSATEAEYQSAEELRLLLQHLEPAITFMVRPEHNMADMPVEFVARLRQVQETYWNTHDGARVAQAEWRPIFWHAGRVAQHILAAVRIARSPPSSSSSSEDDSSGDHSSGSGPPGPRRSRQPTPPESRSFSAAGAEDRWRRDLILMTDHLIERQEATIAESSSGIVVTQARRAALDHLRATYELLRRLARPNAHSYEGMQAHLDTIRAAQQDIVNHRGAHADFEDPTLAEVLTRLIPAATADAAINPSIVEPEDDDWARRLREHLAQVDLPLEDDTHHVYMLALVGALDQRSDLSTRETETGGRVMRPEVGEFSDVLRVVEAVLAYYDTPRAFRSNLGQMSCELRTQQLRDIQTENTGSVLRRDLERLNHIIRRLLSEDPEFWVDW